MRLDRVLLESLAAQGWRVTRTAEGRSRGRKVLRVYLEPTRQDAL